MRNYNNSLYPTSPFDQSNTTQRPIKTNRQEPFVGSSSDFTVPGTKSLHLFNTLLLVFTAVQVGLYMAQGISAKCSQRTFLSLINQVSGIFYAFMGVYIFTLMVPIILWVCTCTKKGHTFAILYTILAIIGKIGVVVAIFVTTENHVGNCYVTNDVKVGVAIANAAEACCLGV